MTETPSFDAIWVQCAAGGFEAVRPLVFRTDVRTSVEESSDHFETKPLSTLEQVLPKGFLSIRYFGWLADRRRGNLPPLCRALLAQKPP